MIVSGAGGIGIRTSPDLIEFVSPPRFFKGRTADILPYRKTSRLWRDLFVVGFHVLC